MSKGTIDFGAVYFRYSAPYEYDWEKDYKKASEDGITHFRHWLPWAAIEPAPGVYNWEPYDKLVALGNKYGIKTVLAEMSQIYPDWFYAANEHARIVSRLGEKKFNNMNQSSIAGGAASLCMDYESVREGVAGFLKALGEHFKGVEGILGYDVWNECTLYEPANLCFCDGTEKEFQDWLKNKYKTLDAINDAWKRHSYTDWSQIRLPRMIAPIPELFDMLRFQNDLQEKWLAFRMDVLRKVDPTHNIIAHGNAKGHSDLVCAGDDWRYAKLPDIYGYTLWYANNCTSLMGGDMLRSACGDKEFWRAEAIGDGTWEYRSEHYEYEPRKDEMHNPENIRIDAMESIVAGASAFVNPRYRGLFDGSLYHAYGWYAPNGERTNRSEEVARLASWCHSDKVKELWSAKPVRGQVGLLLLEDSQYFSYAMYKETDIYASSLRGVHQAFVDSGIQADIIRMSQIDDYAIIYVPYPVAVADKDAETLKAWVENGGTLISEGCFGYFNDCGHAIETAQPNRGFGDVFGCVQEEVHMGPDGNKNTVVYSGQGQVRGGVYRQSYKLTSGKAEGYYPEGDIAIVSNSYGKGKALLFGSMAGYGYDHNADETSRCWFASLLCVAGVKPAVAAPYNRNITIRIWEGADSRYAWVFNYDGFEQNVEVDFDAAIGTPELLRGDEMVVRGNSITVRIPRKDVAVVKI